MSLQPFNILLYQEDLWWVAQCDEPDLCTQGNNEEECIANMQEALRLHLYSPCSTQASTEEFYKMLNHLPERFSIRRILLAIPEAES